MGGRLGPSVVIFNDISLFLDCSLDNHDIRMVFRKLQKREFNKAVEAIVTDMEKAQWIT